jgi:predicted transcriptional regulator
MMIMFIGAAMIKADQKATEEFEQLKLLNLARFIDENEVLINRKKLFENVNFVIHSDFKQQKISSAFNIMNSDEWEQRDKKHGDGRQKRKCCASIL